MSGVSSGQLRDAIIVGFILGVATLIWMFWPRKRK